MNIPKFKGFGKTPSSNTGLNSHNDDNQQKLINKITLSSELDWLAGTLRVSLNHAELLDLVEYVGSALDDEFIRLDHGKALGNTYFSCLWQSARTKCMFLAQHDPELNQAYIYISIVGKACRGDQENLMRLICYLRAKGFKATRIDCATSDLMNRLKFRDIVEAVDHGDCKGFRPESRNGFKKISGVNDRDWTAYLGSRGSDAFTRIYHTTENGYVRIEREYHDTRADAVFQCLANIYELKQIERETMLSTLFQMIRNFSVEGIDFIKRTSKNLSRCIRLEWWNSFLKACDAEPVRIPTEKKESTIEKKKAHIDKQYAASLAMILQHDPEYFYHWIRGLVSQGKERMTDTQKAIVRIECNIRSARDIRYSEKDVNQKIINEGWAF